MLLALLRRWAQWLLRDTLEEFSKEIAQKDARVLSLEEAIKTLQAHVRMLKGTLQKRDERIWELEDNLKEMHETVEEQSLFLESVARITGGDKQEKEEEGVRHRKVKS